RANAVPAIRAVAVLVRRSINTPELATSALVPATLPVLQPLRDRASCGSPFIIRGGVYAVACSMLAAAVLVERRQAHEIPVADTAEIGRASCRERVKRTEVRGWMQRKTL